MVGGVCFLYPPSPPHQTPSVFFSPRFEKERKNVHITYISYLLSFPRTTYVVSQAKLIFFCLLSRKSNSGALLCLLFSWVVVTWCGVYPGLRRGESRSFPPCSFFCVFKTIALNVMRTVVLSLLFFSPPGNG